MPRRPPWPPAAAPAPPPPLPLLRPAVDSRLLPLTALRAIQTKRELLTGPAASAPCGARCISVQGAATAPHQPMPPPMAAQPCRLCLPHCPLLMPLHTLLGWQAHSSCSLYEGSPGTNSPGAQPPRCRHPPSPARSPAAAPPPLSRCAAAPPPTRCCPCTVCPCGMYASIAHAQSILPQPENP